MPKTPQKKKDPPKRVSDDDFKAMVDFYRDNPGATVRCAEATGFNHVTCRKAWIEGWPRRNWDPISIILAQEAVAARAALHDDAIEKQREQHAAELERGYADAEKARQQVIAARRQEGELVKGERANILALLGVTGRVLRGALKMGPKLEAQIRTGKDVDGKPLTIREQIDLLWKVARAVKLGGEATHQIVQTERLLLGEPTEILGVKKDLDNLSEADAIAALRRAGEMADRMERRKELRLKLIQGGQATGTDDAAPTNGASNGKSNGAH